MSQMYKVEGVFDKVTQSLEIWKNLIGDIYEEDEAERNGQMNILKKYVESYAQMEGEYEKTKAALQSLDEKLDSEVKCEDVDSLYKECFNTLPAASSNNYQDSRVWQAVFKGITDVMEVHQKKKTLKDSDYENLGDSLLCSNVFTPPLDPISKVVVKNAYKNKRCGHIYELDTISDYIRRLKTKAKCPYVGCNNTQLRMTDLVQDSQLQSQITGYLETHHSDEDSEDD